VIAEGRSSGKKAQNAQEKAPFYHLLRILRLFAAGSAIGSGTTDFADATDQNGIPFVICCKDRFGQPRAEVAFHPCYPCHPWFSIPVFGFKAAWRSASAALFLAPRKIFHFS
jgi:hypothetical protein